MWFVSRQTNFICRKPHNYQTTLFLFRGLYRLGHKQALLKPGSTGLLLSVFLPPNVRHREAEVVLASGSGPPLPCPEAPSAMQVGTVLLAWLLPTHQVLTGLISFLLASPKKISSFPEAGVMTCVSAKASLSTFPDLQMREAKGQSITIGQDMMEKQKLLLWCLGGCLFWIEREREMEREVRAHPAPSQEGDGG